MQYDANFNSADYSMLNSSAVSHDRQQSLVNGKPGIVNVSQFTENNTDPTNINTGGRKPTADSTAYTLYKPGGKQHLRGKFSNGGGSIDGI